MSKILLVEDDQNLLEIYQARLAAEGYEVITATDGEDALATAVKTKPDLVISDVMMPRVSGFEMLNILRHTDGMQGVKTIMLTALGQDNDRSKASELGADRYLVKSQVTLEDIVDAVKEILGDNNAPVAEAAPQTANTSAAAPEATPPPQPSAPNPPVAIAQPTEPSPTPPPAPSPTQIQEPAPAAPIDAAPPAPTPAVTEPDNNITQPQPSTVAATPSEPVAAAPSQDTSVDSGKDNRDNATATETEDPKDQASSDTTQQPVSEDPASQPNQPVDSIAEDEIELAAALKADGAAAEPSTEQASPQTNNNQPTQPAAESTPKPTAEDTESNSAQESSNTVAPPSNTDTENPPTAQPTKNHEEVLANALKELEKEQPPSGPDAKPASTPSEQNNAIEKADPNNSQSISGHKTIQPPKDANKVDINKLLDAEEKPSAQPTTPPSSSATAPQVTEETQGNTEVPTEDNDPSKIAL